MPRPKNVAPTRQLTISTGENVVELLNSLAATQLYGKNAAEVAERLIADKLDELVDQGKLPAPPRGKCSWENEARTAKEGE
jgi:hypothetical protein